MTTTEHTRPCICGHAPEEHLNNGVLNPSYRGSTACRHLWHGNKDKCACIYYKEADDDDDN